MSQIRIDLPQGNILTIEDRDSNDRFDTGDLIRINGEVYRPNNLSCGANENVWQYFLNMLGVPSIDQARSLNAAARIFQTRQSALMEVHEGHCEQAEELLQTSNLIAHENGMPTSSSEHRPNLIAAYLLGLTTFYNASIELDPSQMTQMISLTWFETCDGPHGGHPFTSGTPYIIGESQVIGCSSCQHVGSGEREPLYFHEESRGDPERIRNSNRRANIFFR